MKVLVLKGNKYQSLLHRVFVSEVEEDYDVEITTKSFSSIELKDVHSIFIVGGELAKEVKGLIISAIRYGINVYYVNNDLKINRMYLKKFIFLYCIKSDKYNYPLSSIFPIKMNKNDLKF